MSKSKLMQHSKYLCVAEGVWMKNTNGELKLTFTGLIQIKTMWKKYVKEIYNWQQNWEEVLEYLNDKEKGTTGDTAEPCTCIPEASGHEQKQPTAPAQLNTSLSPHYHCAPSHPVYSTHGDTAMIISMVAQVISSRLISSLRVMAAAEIKLKKSPSSFENSFFLTVLHTYRVSLNPLFKVRGWQFSLKL